MSNIVIVGSGPAGVSAALYAVRAGVDTTVLTKGPGALDRAEKIENYYGLAQPVSGAELERRSIENCLVLVGLELGFQCFAEAYGLCSDDMHQRAALSAGEHGAVYLLFKLLLAEDERAARPAQGLMRSRRDDVGIGNRTRMLPCCDKSGDVRHVDHKIRPDRVRDLAHALKIYEPRVCARTRYNELRTALLGALLHLIVIDRLRLWINAIEAGVEVLTGNGRLGAVGQVTAVAQIHAEDGITRLEESEIHRNIRL